MLRVAQVVTRFIAGAGNVALRGALALDPSAYSVTVLTGQGGPLLDAAKAGGMELVMLRHMRHQIDPLNDIKAYRELVLQLGGGRFDVVHTHSAKAGFLGRLAARRAGVPAVVHTFHGFPFHDFQARPMRATYIEIERRLGRITDQFLAVGGQVAAEAIRLGIVSPESVRTIPSAVDAGIVESDPIQRRQARRLLGLPEDLLVVGTVGRLAAQKAPQDMVAAMAAIDRPDVRFVWIGGGPMESRIKRLVRRRGLEDRFILLGERADVGRLLPALDLFAMSSLYEGLPCSIAEAMTCGLPVVATTVNAVPELVVPGQTGLLAPPAAPRALARALAYMLDHPEERARMAAAGRKLVVERFRPDVLGRELQAAYESAMEGRAGTAPRRLEVVRPA